MKVYRLAGTVVSTEDEYYMQLFEMDYISAKMVEKYLKEANGEDIVFNLNSGGGSVYAGSEIYTMLSSYSGHITVNITSLSASIASILMMGADEVNISHQAKIMIHQPSMFISGGVQTQDLDKVKNALSSTEKSMVKVYAKKTGLPEDKILDMMVKETWLTSDEALELGFVDNIYGDDIKDSQSELVAMVMSTNEQLEFLKELKKVKGESMNKDLLDKIKGIIRGETNSTDTVDEIKEDATEEVVEDTGTENEQEVDAKDENTELLEKAIAEIESLRAENARLSKENKDLMSEKNTLEEANKTLTIKDKKSQDVVARLNDLLEKEEVNIVTVSHDKEVNASSHLPKGYKGIRGGQ